MESSWIIDYCLRKKGARGEHPFGDDPLVIKVASKMFALISDRSSTVHISLKCDPHIAESLREQYQAVIPGYHLNKKHWNTVICDGSLSKDELSKMIDHSYGLVVKGLKKSERPN